MVLATVLAAVAVVGGPAEVSGSCSRLVSVSSSFDGVISTGGSVDMIGVGGVSGGTELGSSSGIGGGNAGIFICAGSGVDLDASTGVSCTGAACGAFGGAGAATGLYSILAQLRVPSGLELGFCNSAVGAEAVSGTFTFSHEDSIGVISVSG